MRSIESLRAEIDRIDDRLIELYEQRMSLAAEIAAVKKETEKAVLDLSREESILKRLENRAGESVAPYVRELYAAVFSTSRKYQRSLTENGEKK